jgi:hypothetical protein
MNRVVARYADGRVLKGMTADFFPAKPSFHLTPTGAPPGSEPVEIQTRDLKAVFFVKDFEGDPDHVDRLTFDRPPMGRKIKVVFRDGEILVGTTQGYQPGRPGFFVEPADSGANAERCYVVSAATKETGFI